MPTASLPADEVRRIRESLALTRDDLASQLDVSPDAIKSWEDGSRNCSGPARLILLLMQQLPNVLELLRGEPGGLPRANAMPRSPEWFKLQRLLNLIGLGTEFAYWTEVYVEENFNEEWLSELEDAALLERNPRNHNIRRISGVGELKFHRAAWLRWRKTFACENTRDIPVMTPELLDEFAKSR